MPMFDKGCQTVSQRRPAQDGGSCPDMDGEMRALACQTGRHERHRL